MRWGLMADLRFEPISIAESKHLITTPFHIPHFSCICPSLQSHQILRCSPTCLLFCAPAPLYVLCVLSPQSPCLSSLMQLANSSLQDPPEVLPSLGPFSDEISHREKTYNIAIIGVFVPSHQMVLGAIEGILFIFVVVITSTSIIPLYFMFPMDV